MNLAESVRVITRRASRAEAAPRAMPLPRVAIVRARTTLRVMPAPASLRLRAVVRLKIAVAFSVARRLRRRPARRDQLIALCALGCVRCTVSVVRCALGVRARRDARSALGDGEVSCWAVAGGGGGGMRVSMRVRVRVRLPMGVR